MLQIVIANSSDEPIYAQIVRQVKDLIVEGDLSAGEALPSIRSLARDLRISVITTKRAYDELETAGYIETVAGKGSYVAAESQAMLRESQLRIVEERLLEAIHAAHRAELSLEEVENMLRLLFIEG
ncbi:GntR family transcriptional regulator [Alicyclobacillus curvatus]|nr:GntR family transcriptional regulator [Alicyclobacillus curvatus]